MGRDHLDLVAGPADLLEADGLGEDFLDHAVVICRLVVKQDEAFDPSSMRQLDRDDIARMSPIFLDRDCVAERIHRVEDQHIGVPVECDKWVRFVESGILVLAIGRIDYRFSTPRKAVAVGMVGVELPYAGYRETGDLVGALGLERDELDGRSELVKIDRKPWGRMLRVQCLAQPIVASVNTNSVAGNISGRKKREPHDVVPMGVRQEHVEAVLASRAMLPQHVVAEFAHAGPEVADHIFVATGNNLYTAGVAAVSAAY